MSAAHQTSRWHRAPAPRRPCRPHPFVPNTDLPPDALQRLRCTCGLLEANQVHSVQLTARDDDERAYEARRTGEREDPP